MQFIFVHWADIQTKQQTKCKYQNTSAMIPLIRVQNSLESGNCTAKFPTKFLNQINLILTEATVF